MTGAGRLNASCSCTESSRWRAENDQTSINHEGV